MKKFLALIMACVLIVGITPVQALAANTPSIYEFNQNGFQISVAYSVDDSIVTEKITIVERDLSTSMIERVINPDGVMSVYVDGSLQNTLQSDFYESFIKFAQGNVQRNSNPNSRAYGCGISASHSYVRSSTETIDVKARNYVVSAVLRVLASLLPFPLAGFIFGGVTDFIQYVCDSGVDYIDVTQTQYYVHDAWPGQDLECYHVYLESYNRTSSGGRDVFSSVWDYYQYLI